MSVWNECRTALRQLRKSPGFTFVVVITLGLCIGANTAVYSVLDAVLLREVPYPEPDRLALVVTRGPLGDLKTSQTGGQFEIVRDRASSLDVAAYGGLSGINFSVRGQAAHVRQQRDPPASSASSAWLLIWGGNSSAVKMCQTARSWWC